MLKAVYPAVFVPSEEKEGRINIYFPDLPGALSYGDSLSEALYMARDCACLWLADELNEGNPLPKPSKTEDIKPEGNGFIQYVLCDMDEYMRTHEKKTVRKNVTIPAWLNIQGEKLGLNFSEVLTQALMQKVS